MKVLMRFQSVTWPFVYVAFEHLLISDIMLMGPFQPRRSILKSPPVSKSWLVYHAGLHNMRREHLLQCEPRRMTVTHNTLLCADLTFR